MATNTAKNMKKGQEASWQSKEGLKKLKKPDENVTKILDLAEKGVEPEDISKIVGIEPKDVEQVLKDIGFKKDKFKKWRSKRELYFDYVASMATERVMAALRSMPVKRMHDVLKLTKIMEVFYDKYRLESGQATQNIAILSTLIQKTEEEFDSNVIDAKIEDEEEE